MGARGRVNSVFLSSLYIIIFFFYLFAFRFCRVNDRTRVRCCLRFAPDTRCATIMRSLRVHTEAANLIGQRLEGSAPDLAGRLDTVGRYYSCAGCGCYCRGCYCCAGCRCYCPGDNRVSQTPAAYATTYPRLSVCPSVRLSVGSHGPFFADPRPVIAVARRFPRRVFREPAFWILTFCIIIFFLSLLSPVSISSGIIEIHAVTVLV